MIISYETVELRECCCFIETAERRVGPVYAQRLVGLIAEAEAFNDASELIEYLGKDIEVSKDDLLVVQLGLPYMVTFVPSGTKYSRDASNRVKWATVVRLKLIEIAGAE